MLLLDVDNDGDQDLIVAMVGRVIVAANEKDRFRIRASLAVSEDTMSLAAADYDNDGDVDFYVCAYNETESLGGSRSSGLLGGVLGGDPIERPAGAQNTLFRNDVSGKRWQFTDVTEQVGLNGNNFQLSLAASWEDYDNDGDQDLYVANDYGNNQLFRNDGGRFQNVTETSRTRDSGFGMSVTWGDYDRDGWMDVYVSNMFSAAGNRVTFQEQFLKDSPEMKRRLQRFARGNTLLRNAGAKTGFADRSIQAGVTLGRWAWSSHFVDVNNDGWEDLVVANGFLTTDDTGDL